MECVWKQTKVIPGFADVAGEGEVLSLEWPVVVALQTVRLLPCSVADVS